MQFQGRNRTVKNGLGLWARGLIDGLSLRCLSYAVRRARGQRRSCRLEDCDLGLVVPPGLVYQAALPPRSVDSKCAREFPKSAHSPSRRMH